MASFDSVAAPIPRAECLIYFAWVGRSKVSVGMTCYRGNALWAEYIVFIHRIMSASHCYSTILLGYVETTTGGTHIAFCERLRQLILIVTYCL